MSHADGSKAMLTPIREIEVGDGVIDCALDVTGEFIVAGDVSGRGIVFSGHLEKLAEVSFEMPLWGAAIHSPTGIATFALADKTNSKGGFSLYDFRKDKITKTIAIDGCAWDTVITPDGLMAYVSTWDSGILWCRLDTCEVGRIPIAGHIFGLSLLEDFGHGPLLTATIAGVGVAAVKLPASGPPKDVAATLLVRSPHSCYKHGLSEDHRNVISGSSDSLVPFATAAAGGPELAFSTRTFRSLMRDVCGVTSFGRNVFAGSLAGDLQVSRVTRPDLPLGLSNVGSSIWSISPNSKRNGIWIARGDGFIAEYLSSDLENSSAENSDLDGIMFGPGTLGGAKVFISYASEDYEMVHDTYRFLKSVGCRPWLDRFNILPGQNWRAEIAKGLRESDFIVVCLSSRSVNKRGYVQKEVKTALDLLDEMPENEIFLVPARLEDCPVPPELASRQWVDLYKDEGHRRLCMAIYAGLGSRGLLDQES